MSRLHGASGARNMAMCRAAARFQARRMPAARDQGVQGLTCADRGEKDVAHASGSDS